MCLALGIQNDALRKTSQVGIHSTYMTGMVTTLIQKGYTHLFPDHRIESKPATVSTSTTIQVIGPMWLSFILGALGGAVAVARFHTIGLLGIALLLSLLICAETKTTWTRK